MATWDRVQGESSKSFEKFCYYRDLGAERTQKAIAEHFRTTLRNINLLAQKWGWVKRVEAWDDHQDLLTQEQRTGDIQKVRERHAMLGSRMQIMGAKRLDNLLDAATGEIDDALTPFVAVRMQVEGAKMERDALGMSKQTTGVLAFSHEELITFSDDELIEQLKEELGLV